MKKFTVLLLGLLLCAASLTGCSGTESCPTGPDDSFLYTAPAAAWEGDAPQDVIDLLETNGYTPSRTSTDPSILHGQRWHMELNGDKLHAVAVYKYESSEAAQVDADCISTDGYTITFPQKDGTVSITDVHWVDQPHFYRDGAYIILYIGQDNALINAFAEAYGAPFAGPEAAADCGTE